MKSAVHGIVLAAAMVVAVVLGRPPENPAPPPIGSGNTPVKLETPAEPNVGPAAVDLPRADPFRAYDDRVVKKSSVNPNEVIKLLGVMHGPDRKPRAMIADRSGDSHLYKVGDRIGGPSGPQIKAIEEHPRVRVIVDRNGVEEVLTSEES